MVQGFVLAALRMQVVSIWPLVLLHAASNLLVLAAPPGAVPNWWEALQLVVMLAVGLLLIRRTEHTDQSPASDDA